MELAERDNLTNEGDGDCFTGSSEDPKCSYAVIVVQLFIYKGVVSSFYFDDTTSVYLETTSSAQNI